MECRKLYGYAVAERGGRTLKRKVIALIIAAVMSLPGIAAVAADPEITCNLDTAAEEKKLYVAADSGTFEKDTVINLVIMNPGRMLDKAAETGAVFYADGKKADNMGRVSFEVSFDKAALGIYQIYLIPSGSGETYTQEVTYLMGDFDKRFLEKINGDDGATTEGIKAVMTSDDAKTFLKDTISEELKDDSFMYEYMVSARPYDSLYDVQTAYNTGKVLALFNEGGGTQRVKLAEKYGDEYFALKSNEDMYNMYSDSSRKEDICSNAGKNLKTSEAVAKAIYDSTVLTSVKLSSWSEIDGILKAAKSYLTNIDYEKAAAKTEQVGKAVAGNTYSDISAFEKAVKTAYEKNSSGGTTGGGTTGGEGGISGGSRPTVSGTVDPYKPQTEKENILFTDQEAIPDYAMKYLSRLKEDGVFSGDPDGSFRPDSPILRQEFCKVLTVGLNPEKTDEAISFSDVAADAWYAEFVQRAAAAGYVKGKTDGSFGVDESLTREDLAVILERIVKAMPEVTVGDTAAEYNDFDKVSDYAAEAVKYVTAAGLMEGYDGGFAPKENVTRAQIAAVLGRLLYEL